MNKDKLNQIIHLAKINNDIEVIWLYGSQARGCATHKSDYDLAVAFKSYIEDPIERRLRPELLAIKWNKIIADIDLSIIDINFVPLPLAYTVINDNTLLNESNNYRRMTEEQRIMSKWELDYLYHKKKYA